MKIRESGMPKEDLWNSFFDVPKILSEMEIDKKVEHLAEFGCGYGTFTLEAAKAISGLLFAFDIVEKLTDMVSAKTSGMDSVAIINRDFEATGTGLPKKSIDYLMLFNIMHHDKPEVIYKEAFRILKPDGKVGIIHWRNDIAVPAGLKISIRPKPEDLLEQFDPEKFSVYKDPFVLEPYHFGIILQKIS